MTLMLNINDLLIWRWIGNAEMLWAALQSARRCHFATASSSKRIYFPNS